MPQLKVYTYANCGTCRKAVSFLNANHVYFQEIPIRETPPSVAELKTMLGAYEGNLRKLFNTSGLDYKSMGLSEKLPTMSQADALKLLSSNGNLVKRPFVIGEKAALVGFDELAWRQRFS